MNSHWKNAEPDPAKLEVLAGWKAIAGYFACNVRTVRRYEQERGLPVHRAPGKKGGTVFAYPSELDTWLESREKERGLNLAILTSPAEQRVGDVPRTNSLWADATTLPAISADERQAKPTSILRRRLWVFAASALLVSSVALSWQFGNHPAARATTWSQLDPLRVNQKVPARGTEDLFLRGRYFWNLRTADGLAKAIDFYTQAIVTDPSYAEAYAGLAESYDLLPQFGHADLGDSFRKAEVAADRAIELNPNLASAHRAKAFALFFWDWDIPGSDAEFQKALALDPNSAQTHQWYASTLLNRLESSDCLKQIDEALRLSPTSASVTADAAFMHEEFDPDPEAGFRRLVELEQTEPTLLSPKLLSEGDRFCERRLPSIHCRAPPNCFDHASSRRRSFGGCGDSWVGSRRQGRLACRNCRSSKGRIWARN